MSNLKILIVDDEPLARSRLTRMVGELLPAADIQSAKSGLEALEIIPQLNPDIVLLDVQMPGLDGLEVLQQIEVRNFAVIFQTAHDEYAVKAFEESACDYLLKPFTRERLHKALERATKTQAQASVSRVEKAFREKKGGLKKVLIRQSGKTRIVDIQNVMCFVSRDHYTCVHTEGLELICDLSLSRLEELLDPTEFVRCHRNNIIAVSQIKSLLGTVEGEVELINGMRLPVSRHRRHQVLAALNSSQ